MILDEWIFFPTHTAFMANVIHSFSIVNLIALKRGKSVQIAVLNDDFVICGKSFIGYTVVNYSAMETMHKMQKLHRRIKKTLFI